MLSRVSAECAEYVGISVTGLLLWLLWQFICLKYADDKYIKTWCQEIDASVMTRDIQQSSYQQLKPQHREP